MSDVLSNDQIELLLKEIDKIEKDGKKDKNVRVYDFFVPNRLSKERIKILANIFDNFSRALSMFLSSTFRMGCGVRVDNITEKRFGEFLDGFAERELMGVVDIVDEDTQKSKDKIAIKMPNKFCLFVFVKLLGDNGDRIYQDKSMIGRSEIEIAMIEYFVQRLIPHLGSAWRLSYPVDFKFDEVDSNPKVSRIMNVNNNVVDVQLEFMLSKMKHMVNFCIPSSFLDDMFEYIDRNLLELDDVPNEKNEGHIMRNIEDSKLEIRTVLDNIQLTLGDVYNLQPGDMIKLDKRRDEEVDLYIGDTVWFTGNIGTNNNNIAVKINNVIKRFSDEEV